MADIAELADVELGVEEMVQVEPVPGIDLVRILAEGHVCDVEQLLNFQVVGVLFEILGKVLDRQTGTGRIRVNGRR